MTFQHVEFTFPTPFAFRPFVLNSICMKSCITTSDHQTINVCSPFSLRTYLSLLRSSLNQHVVDFFHFILMNCAFLLIYSHKYDIYAFHTEYACHVFHLVDITLMYNMLTESKLQARICTVGKLGPLTFFSGFWNFGNLHFQTLHMFLFLRISCVFLNVSRLPSTVTVKVSPVSQFRCMAPSSPGSTQLMKEKAAPPYQIFFLHNSDAHRCHWATMLPGRCVLQTVIDSPKKNRWLSNVLWLTVRHDVSGVLSSAHVDPSLGTGTLGERGARALASPRRLGEEEKTRTFFYS